MTLTELFVAQLEREGALTRKALQRVPEGQNGFKPHERSMELGYLAALVAGMPGWIAFMIERDELDLDRPDSEGFAPGQSRQEQNCWPASTRDSINRAKRYGPRQTSI